jgi:hypothetical protein
MGNPKFSPELRPTGEILADFWERLPSLAKDLIEQSLDMSLETNRQFRDNPDSPAEVRSVGPMYMADRNFPISFGLTMA